MTTTRPTDALKLNISARLIAAVAQARAKVDIRYYLSGVYVQRAERGGVYIVATNGSAMLVAHDATGLMEWHVDGEEKPRDGVILSASDNLVREAAKRRPKSIVRGSFDGPRVVVEDGRLSVAMDVGFAGSADEFYIQPGRIDIDYNKYPDWAKVVPDFNKIERGHAGLFNENLLMTFRDAGQVALSKSRRQRCNFSGIQLWGYPGESRASCLVQFAYVPEMIGVLMPMHDDAPKQFKRLMANMFPVPKKEGA